MIRIELTGSDTASAATSGAMLLNLLMFFLADLQDIFVPPFLSSGDEGRFAMPIDVVKFTAGFMWLTPMATFSPCGGLRSRAPSADGDLHRGFQRMRLDPRQVGVTVTVRKLP